MCNWNIWIIVQVEIACEIGFIFNPIIFWNMCNVRWKFVSNFIVSLWIILWLKFSTELWTKTIGFQSVVCLWYNLNTMCSLSRDQRTAATFLLVFVLFYLVVCLIFYVPRKKWGSLILMNIFIAIMKKNTYHSCFNLRQREKHCNDYVTTTTFIFCINANCSPDKLFI